MIVPIFNILFILSFILSCIFFVMSIAFSVGGWSETWTRRSGRGLLYSCVPIVVWVFSLVFKAIPVLSVTVVTWIVITAMLLSRKIKQKMEQVKLLQKGKHWRCPSCKLINEDIYINCTKCNTAKPQHTVKSR